MGPPGRRVLVRRLQKYRTFAISYLTRKTKINKYIFSARIGTVESEEKRIRERVSYNDREVQYFFRRVPSDYKRIPNQQLGRNSSAHFCTQLDSYLLNQHTANLSSGLRDLNSWLIRKKVTANL